MLFTALLNAVCLCNVCLSFFVHDFSIDCYANASCSTCFVYGSLTHGISNISFIILRDVQCL